MPLFKKGKLRQEKKLELANQLDQRNKTSTKRRLKARAKLRIRVERNGDFGIGPQTSTSPLYLVRQGINPAVILSVKHGIWY